MITVSFGVAPGGKPCIVMTTDNERRYALLTSKRAPLAGRLINQLKADFDCEALPGIPLNWRKSFSQNELISHDGEGIVGVYVQEDRFAYLIELFAGQL